MVFLISLRFQCLMQRLRMSSPKKPLVIRHEKVKDSTVGYPKLPQLKKNEKTSIEMGRLDIFCGYYPIFIWLVVTGIYGNFE